MDDQEILLKSVHALSDNFHFKQFMKEVARLRTEAHDDAEQLENISDTLKTAALLGKAKALREILDLGDYGSAPLD